MDSERLKELLRAVMECPTAPFHEHHVRDRILELLDPLAHVAVEADAFGNLIAAYRRGDAKATLAFGAHMDHPGWVTEPAGAVEGDDPAEGEIRNPSGQGAQFLGGVPERYRDIEKNPIRWFDEGAFAMWDLPDCEFRDGRVHSRVCDDLVGCVAIVAMMEELERREVEGACYGIFTRAEEVGFVGAVQLAKAWPLGEDVRFVSLETSSPRGDAASGAGPVVRAGDRMTVFDDEVTGDLLEAAKRAEIPVQRCLLDGGSCEATAMQLYGVRAAGISVLLDGYHNCGPDDRIVTESVDLGDTDGLVELITSLVARDSTDGDGEPVPTAREAMKRRVEQRIAEHQRFADATAERFGRGNV